MSTSYRKYLVRRVATMLIMACGLLEAGSGTALAGTNGQKINYFSRNSYGQCTTGKNEKNETVRNCTQLHSGANPDQNYQWVGIVRITWYYPDDSYSPTLYEIPKNQESSDYVTCNDPG